MFLSPSLGRNEANLWRLDFCVTPEFIMVILGPQSPPNSSPLRVSVYEDVEDDWTIGQKRNWANRPESIYHILECSFNALWEEVEVTRCRHDYLYSAAEAGRLLQETTGVTVSLRFVCALMHQQAPRQKDVYPNTDRQTDSFFFTASLERRDDPAAVCELTQEVGQSAPMGFDNETNQTLQDVAPYSLRISLPLTVLVGIMILLIVFGNVLVVIAVFTSRALRAPPQNLFLVSLASADILVATLVMPFSLANELMGYWYFGEVWCEIYLALDVLFCTASIAHLCAISLDRYWSITQAIEYNLKRTPRRIKCIIFIVWVIAAVISFPPLITMEKENSKEDPVCKINNDKWYVISSCIGSFFLPCVIMVLVYVRIYQIAKKRTRAPPGDRKRKEMPKKATIAAANQKENGVGNAEERLCHEKLNGEQEIELKEGVGGEEGADEEKGEVNGVDLEESSSSDHKRAPSTKGSRWKGRQNREKRFTFVLAVVIGVFVICWFPFFFTYMLMTLCESCPVPDTLFKFFFWFGYCNTEMPRLPLTPDTTSSFSWGDPEATIWDYVSSRESLFCMSWPPPGGTCLGWNASLGSTASPSEALDGLPEFLRG
ncbi:hypothetical protein L3Q82_005284 [Scortum barcoo]|uniref:Uncharacterized protein n=1 Tax=Scortum barcoo TaxID=214431 RepID=A0ACB8V9H1_9TELE|nr:hypothetical protein L3Q82_005284 [Scortum barcoo]